MDNPSLQAAAILVFIVALTRCALAEGISCPSAATIAEQEQSLPAGLLEAIGKVESNGNPRAIDVNGTAVVPADADEAVAIVKAAKAEGAHSIDVGCFQVNLHWHPDAFPILADAFDPLHNARIAARFLALLRRNAPSWETAVARYHSTMAVEGTNYARRVLAYWRNDPAILEDDNNANSRVRAGPRLFAFGIRVIKPGEGAFPSLGLPVVVTP